jgi:type I restriction enzyme S subunit
MNKVTLDEVCELIVDCEHKTAPKQDAGYPSIRTPNIGRGYFILENVNRVSRETYEKWTQRAVPQYGDLIIAREAPVGNVAMIPKGLEVCLGQRTVLIRPDQTKADSRFLTYLLLGDEVQGSIHSQTNGATVAHLNMRDIRSLELQFLPDLPTQRKIAGILSAYDDLIENNLRRIKILEQMAQCLYREWFVHFRFPGHESSKFIDSELGQIPKGWEIKKLGQLADQMRRGVSKGELDGTVRYVGLEHIPRQSLALDSWEETAELGSNKLSFERGEVLFGKIRPYFHKVSVAPFDGICSADTIVIRSKKQEHRALVTACVFTEAFVAHATATSNGSKMPRTDWKVLRDYPHVLPPKELLTRFSDLFENAVAQQQSLVSRNQTLRRTRDLLLPKLLGDK